MDLTHIAELNPELSERDSKSFKAAVTLIWPYSSSQREFALLLAEPDFRLRRKKGQVRARFTGSSAKALATTGVGIGDQVVLSVRGAQFVKEGTVSTPGKSIDWELEYAQTVVVQVFRDGTEIASLDLVDAAPTPAPRSPVRRLPTAAPTPAKQWSSPAFLKRARLSDGPIFDTPYDPLADENGDGHDKKRRRKSYRDWKTWTYSARTPSPEKGDVGMEEDSEAMDASPSRPTQLPHTPVSPQKPGLLSVAAGPIDHAQTPPEEAQDEDPAAASTRDDDTVQEEPGVKAPHAPALDDFVRDGDYYDRYAGPDENPPADAQYAFGGDTEANTEDEADAQDDTDGVSFSTTEVNTEVPEQYQVEEQEAAHPEVRPEVDEHEAVEAEEDNTIEVVEVSRVTECTVADTEVGFVELQEEKSFPVVEQTPTLAMPPPTLPALTTSFTSPGLLTPVGKEPASPTLQPLDSALLPLPSPFPGECDTNITSYFDHASTDQPIEVPETIEEDQPPSEASYIMENSFFSSIGSSKNRAFHPDHESAFTPVRFTFGMDGAGFSRPLQLSSPVPEVAQKDDETQRHSAKAKVPQEPDMVLDTGSHRTANKTGTSSMPESVLVQTGTSPPRQHSQNEEEHESEVIELSSDSEEEALESATEDADDVDMEYVDEGFVRESDFDHFDTNEHVTFTKDDEREESEPMLDHQNEDIPEYDIPTSTNQSIAVSEVVDLGSPSGSSDIEEPIPGSETQSGGKRMDKDQDRDQYSDSEELDGTSVKSPEVESHSELQAMDYAPVIPSSIRSAQREATTHTPAPQQPDIAHNARKDHKDGYQPQLGTDNSDVTMQEASTEADAAVAAQEIREQVEELHPDIKLESIEEDPVLQASELDMAEGSVIAGASAEILIEVPDEGHKLGETYTIPVPATGPARNTRSKTKPSMSPTKEESPVLKRTTRSTRSKASVASAAQTTLTPPRTRTRSTMSPSQDATQTSPYSLRSQSKHLSPTQSTSTSAATRRSPRKQDLNRSMNFSPGVGPSQLDDPDSFLSSFQPSQELGASQGRYSTVSFVKDSEEESIHSENSLSTMKYSDDWNTFTNISDPVMPNVQKADDESLKPPPATAPQAQAGMGAKTKSEKSQTRTENQAKSSPTQPDFSVITQPPQSSPYRRLRSAGATEAPTSSSPHATRTTRRQVYNISTSPQPTEELPDEATPRASQVADSVSFTKLPSEGESNEVRSSPPAPMDTDESLRDSPPVTPLTFLSVYQRSAMNSNRPITPEATQQTNIESQASVADLQQQQTLPMTPQLTQGTSAGLRSFSQSATSNTIKKTPTKPSPNVVTRSTPRRNATQTDVASPSTSPIEQHSPDISSDADETTLVVKSTGPSIGLSTPLAYYTPLNSLTYFLNRSSQFHTASNPDILALVTSPSTPAQKSSKGRKDWTTSLQISDASTWPSTTTVNIFRAYQTALPIADVGDVILLRAMAVKSLNRHPALVSADESAWCVWRYGKPVWGKKRGAFGEVKAREEIRGPEVERGEGEWAEVERIRSWFVDSVKKELEEAEEKKVHTRSHDKASEAEVENGGSQRQTRSKDKEKAKEEEVVEERSQRQTRSKDKGKGSFEG